ncbi:response regulator [Myxacorys almedinensis]|uniref:Response regulator n=1 Tax=Myxacorys almedinensis A TaxID=2690445 RepID=A0A8J7Z5M8_9CYAN|nr:response regulator [Myxacorys almedinensis]NDJ16873.1 response regulator [Myxacorys almedinensis A]
MNADTLAAIDSTAETFHILLVEANEDDANLLRRVFFRAGRDLWNVVQVEQLEEAIELVFESSCCFKFDAVLLDLDLSDSTGLATLTRFRAEIPDLPVIILTTLDDDDLAVRAIQAGAQDYLLKDETTIRQLIGAIHYAIARHNVINFSKNN